MDRLGQRNGLGRAVEIAFWCLARLRSGRAVHAKGTLFRAHLRVNRESLTGAALGGPWARPALVRLSKSLGTSRGLPDLLGVALRVEIPQPFSDTGLLDMLFASAGRHDLNHFVLTPAARWWSRPYSTVLPYHVDGRTRFLGLQAELSDCEPGGAEPVSVETEIGRLRRALVLTERSLTGPLCHVGHLVLNAVPAAPEPVSFDPILNASPRVRPIRLFSRVREWAYAGSRRARGAPERAGPASSAVTALSIGASSFAC
jgi:hypothetical protein